ncbi:MAG: tetratricopeptide repeat protein [Bacteroidota bacterium]
MISDEQYILIERYLEGELTEAELAAFELQVKENPAFAQEVQIHQEIAKAPLEADALAFEVLVKEVAKERKEQSSPSSVIKPIFPRLWIGVAAGISLLLIGYFLWTMFGPSQVYSPDLLYAEYVGLEEQSNLLGYEERQQRGTNIVGIDTTQTAELLQYRDQLRQVDSLYQQQAYMEAKKQLESFLETADPALFSQSDVQFNLGLIYLYLEQWQAAAAAFKLVKGDSKQLADWYTAMAFIRLNQEDNAVDILRGIAENSFHSKQQMAKELLGKLPDFE